MRDESNESLKVSSIPTSKDADILDIPGQRRHSRVQEACSEHGDTKELSGNGVQAVCTCKDKGEAAENPTIGNDWHFEETFQNITEMNDLGLYWNKYLRHVAL